MASQGNGHYTQLALTKVADVPDTPNDPLNEIEVVEYGSGIGGHFLIVRVRYGGGMRDHAFQAYWDGSWMKSDPPGIWINIRHDANDDPGKAFIDETLQIMIDEPANSSYRKFFVLAEGGGAQSESFDVTVKR
jgi:hypothetical protein